jgi:hypothetical protein
MIFFKYLFILLFLILPVVPDPCPAYADKYDLEKNLGLYRITETKCQLSDGLYNPCNEMSYIELVKGKF